MITWVFDVHPVLMYPCCENGKGGWSSDSPMTYHLPAQSDLCTVITTAMIPPPPSSLGHPPTCTRVYACYTRMLHTLHVLPPPTHTPSRDVDACFVLCEWFTHESKILSFVLVIVQVYLHCWSRVHLCYKCVYHTKWWLRLLYHTDRDGDWERMSTVPKAIGIKIELVLSGNINNI